MKNTLLLILAGFLFSLQLKAQSVGINTATPNASAILDIQSKTKGLLIPRMLYAERNLIATPAIGLLIYQTNISPGYYYYNGSSWQQLISLQQLSNTGINSWVPSGNDIYNTNIGNIGIGTTNPINKLQIGDPPGYSGNDIAIGNGTQGMSFFQSTTSSMWYTNTHFSLLPFNGGNGYLGVGIDNPFYQLDVADRMRLRSGSLVNTAGIWFNDPGNTNTIAFVGVKSADQVGIYGINSFWGLLMNTNTGDISIGNQNPVAGYKLSVQGGEYVNGLLVTAGDAEINGAALVYGNLNVGGKIGIGGTPNTPLEIFSRINYNFLTSWTKYGNGSFDTPDLAIQAHGDVLAVSYWATSDARIKDINGISNSTNDLETINTLRITDYTMKDKLQYGNKPFKKVIAQEVEKVYPQVVSKHADFIPNVYQPSDKVTQTKGGYSLHFAGAHHISSTAKKLRVLLDETGGMQELNIIAIPSANEVVIDAKGIKSTKVFVYGEEVADFRTVDYEGLSTLNISATQELSKLEKKQQNQIKQLEKRLAVLEARLSVAPLPLR